MTIFALALGIAVVCGHRIQMDLRAICYDALGNGRDWWHAVPRHKRFLWGVGLPLDGVLFLFFTLLPWFVRRAVLAGISAHMIAELAAWNDLSPEEARNAIETVADDLLGDRVPRSRQQLVEQAIQDYEMRRQ